MFDYAIKANWFGITNNYFSVHRIDAKSVEKAKKKRSNLATDDLKALFSSEQYQNASFKHSYQYWVPLLLLYTGARVQEICQLHCHDVKQVNGIWVLDINEDSATKKTKTLTSVRQIPIHQELLDLGFLEFVDSVRHKRRGGKQLFVDLTYTAQHGFARKYQRWSLGEGSRPGFFQQAGMKRDTLDRKDNHAFRHTLTSALQEVGIPTELRSAITGHKMASGSENTTYSHSQMLQLKQEALHKISFRDITGNVKPFKH
nr:site-specific integrase [Microbulbifer guangxiensis]